MSCIVIARDIGGIAIDVIVSEEIGAEMEIAEHPVERGAKISDHAWRKPRTVKIEGAVDTPRAMDAYQALLDLQEAAEPFDFVSGLKVLPDMLLKSLTAKRDTEHGRILKFEAELQEVIIIATCNAGPDRGTARNGNGDERGAGLINRGQVQARPSGVQVSGGPGEAADSLVA